MSQSHTIYRNNPGTFLGEPFYDWRGAVFEELARYLSSRGTRVRIEERSAFREIPVRDSFAILENDATGDYYALDCHDWVATNELELLVRDARCKRILKCQYRAAAFTGAEREKVRPWTYFDRFWPRDEQRIVADRAVARTSDALYFRGSDWGARDRVLAELRARGVLSDPQKVGFDEYFRESAAYRVMLSLPGIADACNRDVECFGRGACVLRPKFRSEFHNPLAPDYHYVSVDVHVRKTDPVEIADRIERRFREIAGDHAYIESVAKNAARWYDENVRRDAAMRLTSRLLGLEPVEYASAAG